MARRVAKRMWHELELLCATGVGLAPIAPTVCRLLRDIVGADAAAIFWMDERGQPLGFFHEDSNAGARDLFVNEFDRLFAGENELNVATLVRRMHAPAGHLLAPPASYWMSNTYNLLVRASGHHHALDLRIDHEGRARAVVMLFRTRRAFGADDLAQLKATADHLRRAFHGAGDNGLWVPASPSAHLVVDGEGRALMFASDAARLLLQQGNHVAQGVPAEGALRAPPSFARQLCARLDQEVRPQLALPAPNGRLVVQAERLAAPEPGPRRLDGSGEGPPTAVLLALRAERPARLDIVEQVLRQDLSPKQKTILLAAASGVSRADAPHHTGTSPEAMKKHLFAIFAATGARSWTDLSRIFARR